MSKSLKKLEMPTIGLSRKLKELHGRGFCRVKIEKTFFRIRIGVEPRSNTPSHYNLSVKGAASRLVS